MLLLSLNAGGVGLNLVGGNHLFIVDLHWNPGSKRHSVRLIIFFQHWRTKLVIAYIVLGKLKAVISTSRFH